MSFKIDFSSRKDTEESFHSCLISLDGTDCAIQEPISLNRRWFSHKLKRAGLRYEIGLSIFNGNLCWVNGPFPAGSFPDLKFFRNDLKRYLDDSEKVVADRGYNGDEKCVVELTSEESKLRLSRIRSRHETINKRFKIFFVLQHRFRHRRRKHSICFHAVANIVQLSLENHPLFQV